LAGAVEKVLDRSRTHVGELKSMRITPTPGGAALISLSRYDQSQALF